MKVKLQITKLTAGWEVVFETEHRSRQEEHRWEAEKASRHEMALEAIAAAPDEAEHIANRALGTG